LRPPGDILVVADVHLNPVDRSRTEEFYRFLREEGKRASHLIILGDLFDLWLGLPRLQEPHHLELSRLLADLRRQGVRLAYVEGNRDFCVARYQRGPLFQRATRGMARMNRGGRRFVFTHGDLLNRRDYLYRMWNASLRNPLARTLLRHLPRRWVLAAGAYLEARLRLTNRRFRTYFPFRQCASFARGLFASGADVVVLGHFHRRRYFQFVAPGGRKGEVYVLPAWFSSRTCLRISADGKARFWRWDAEPIDCFRPCAPGGPLLR
jgi:UDP-2,3-diacylglucosamine hydrolase